MKKLIVLFAFLLVSCAEPITPNSSVLVATNQPIRIEVTCKTQ